MPNDTHSRIRHGCHAEPSRDVIAAYYANLGLRLAAIAALIAAAICLSGCTSTVRPKAPVAAVASWDGTNQNSGFIGFAGNYGILTAHAAARYNALVERYGTNFTPAIKPGDGLTATATNTFLIDPQHMTYFGDMNRWHKQGK